MMKRQKIWSLLLIIAILTGMFVSAVPVSAATVEYGTYTTAEQIAGILTDSNGNAASVTSGENYVSFTSDTYIQLDETKDYNIEFTYKASGKASNVYAQVHCNYGSDKVLQTDGFPAGQTTKVTIRIRNTAATIDYPEIITTDEANNAVSVDQWKNTKTKTNKIRFAVKNATATLSEIKIIDPGTLVPAPEIQGTVSILGSTVAGSTLTAVTNIVNEDSGAISYKWQSSSDNAIFTDISGANLSTYRLSVSDVNKYIRVLVSSLNTEGSLNATTESVIAEHAAVLAGTYSDNEVIDELLTYENNTTVGKASDGLYFNNNAYLRLDAEKDFTVTFNLSVDNNESSKYVQLFLLDKLDISSSHRVVYTNNFPSKSVQEFIAVTININNKDTDLGSKITAQGISPIVTDTGKKTEYIAIRVNSSYAKISDIQIQEVSAAKASYVGAYKNDGVEVPDGENKLTTNAEKATEIATAYSACFSNVSESVKSHPAIEWTIDFANDSITQIGTARKIIPIDETKITDWSKFGLVINGAYLDESDAAVSAVLRSSAE